MKKIIFTSGLPRSGSTLLSAILNQNPRFESDLTVKILDIFDNISLIVNSDKKYFDGKIENIFRSVLETFHEGEGVHFNHNRGWTGRTELLKNLYPDFKIIVTVRDICWILDSFERLSVKNPGNITTYSNSVYNSNIYERCAQYMQIIEPSYFCLKELIHKDISNAIIIDYDTLVSDPEFVMKSIYKHIDEPYFQHDFNNIENLKNYKIYDVYFKSPDLHYVRKKVSYQERKTLIPSDIWERYAHMGDLWKNIKS